MVPLVGSILLLTPLVSSLPPFVIVNREARIDNTITSAADKLNFGNDFQLVVGPDPDPNSDFGISRTLIDFDLTGFQGRKLSKICLVLYVSAVSANCTPCTEYVNPWDPPAAGCAAAHLVTTTWWGEGNKTGEDVTQDGSSWRYNHFPNEWVTPGGDFKAERIGNLIPEPPESIEAHFILDPGRMQAIIDDPSDFRGFLLMNDENTGYFAMESRECHYFDDSGVAADMRSPCPHKMGKPRIELEFMTEAPTTSPLAEGDPTVSPVAPETLVPTVVVKEGDPTVSPVAPETLTPTVVVEEACGRYSQNVTLTESLSPSDRDRLEGLVEDHLRSLPVEYIADITQLSTRTMVNEFEEVQMQDNVLLSMEYTICFRQPPSVVTNAQLLTYPTEFETYMSLVSSRLTFENFLLGEGISLQARSLTAPVLARDENDNRAQQSSGGGSDNNDGIIIGVSSALGALALVGTLLLVRRRMSARGESKSTEVATPSSEYRETSGGAPVLMAHPLATQREVDPPYDTDNLHYKMQGESHPEEASHQHGPPVKNDEEIMEYQDV